MKNKKKILEKRVSLRMEAVALTADAVRGRHPFIVGGPEPAVDVHRLHVVDLLTTWNYKTGLNQISAKRGPDSSFIVEVNTEVLVSKSNSKRSKYVMVWGRVKETKTP